MQIEQKAALQEKKKHRNELNNLKFLIEKLQQLDTSLEKDLKDNKRVIYQNALKFKNEKRIVQSGKMVQMELDEMTYRFYEMSNQILQSIFQKCTKHVETLNRLSREHQQNVLLGWDDLALAQFSQRFFNTPLTNDEQKILPNKGLLVKENLLIVYEIKLSREKRTELEYIMQQIRFNVYVLTNVVQAGQAKLQLAESKILSLPILRQSVCNLVMQSFKEFLENGAYDEVVDIVAEFKQLTIFKKGEVLVNDASPLFSIMHLHLDHSKAIVHDSTQLTKYLQQKMSYLIDSSLMMHAYNQYLNALMKQTGVK
ncbi:hypothetical protein ABES02_27655 [Neobacillus pocheonensis]|uniref:hypothetical protein n=1 Tax=Neobacillus pocheonensis TaxID=363869 RepID=UPI003D2DC1E8